MSRRILIAEDDSSLRESIQDILSGEGHVCAVAENGRAALEVLSASPVDVLILDLAMPAMNGVELLGAIDPPPPIVVVYSAFEYFTPEELRERCGAKVFKSLRKPVPPAALISAVSDAIDQLGMDD